MDFSGIMDFVNLHWGGGLWDVPSSPAGAYPDKFDVHVFKRAVSRLAEPNHAQFTPAPGFLFSYALKIPRVWLWNLLLMYKRCFERFIKLESWKFNVSSNCLLDLSIWMSSSACPKLASTLLASHEFAFLMTIPFLPVMLLFLLPHLISY